MARTVVVVVRVISVPSSYREVDPPTVVCGAVPSKVYMILPWKSRMLPLKEKEVEPTQPESLPS
jgi:hypothetical protein